MTEPIPPALKPEEWKTLRIWSGGATTLDGNGMVTIENDDYYAGYTAYVENRHGLAALCLHEQTFGFTRRMAALCELAAVELHAQQVYDGRRWVVYGDDVSPAEYEQLAQIIRALLPPAP